MPRPQECYHCLQPDCRRCVYCRDKAKYGGPNIKKQKCERKEKCSNPSIICLLCSGEKPVSCDMCEKKFIESFQLENHKESEHGTKREKRRSSRLSEQKSYTEFENPEKKDENEEKILEKEEDELKLEAVEAKVKSNNQKTNKQVIENYDDSDDSDVYEVEKILDVRENGRRTEYLVKWKGWENPEDKTWEPEKSLADGSAALLKEFKLRNSQKKKTKEQKNTKRRNLPEEVEFVECDADVIVLD